MFANAASICHSTSSSESQARSHGWSSWLSYAGIDRRGDVLPWNAPEGVPRLSPLEASARYLAHLRAAVAKDRIKELVRGKEHVKLRQNLCELLTAA